MLYRHFEEDMGEEKAKTLMDHLLPVGWTELATKHEVKALELKVDQIRETMATKVELLELKAEMYKGFKSLTLALMGLMVTLQAITIATVRLI